MRLLLDTNICIYAMKHKPASVLRKLQTMSPDDVGVSIITAAELWYGAKKSLHPERNRSLMTTFLAEFQVLPFNEPAAEHYSSIRTHLEQVGQVIGELDMLIAGQARCLDLTLVTHNTREFERVPNLHIEDWYAAP